MLISAAHAAETGAQSADAGEAVFMQLALIFVLVLLFYFLMIRPQQKRFKHHAEMLKDLQQGEKVVTQGGLIGKIEKMPGDDILVLDVGNGTEITVLRSSIASKYEEVAGKKGAANTNKDEKSS